MTNINDGIIFLDKALQSRRGLSADLALSEYVAAPGELIIATDTGEIRYGDGVNAWKNLRTCDNTRIANNLEAVDSGDALDAAQGRVLNNRLITLEGIRGIDCGEINFYISIDRDETQPITDFYHYKYASLSFTATYLAPSGLAESSSPEWIAEGLPEGLTAEISNGVLTISGYAQEVCSKDVTISVSLGECSDTKIFTFQVTKDDKAIEISNSDLGDWGIGVAGSVTLTTNTTGSVSGTARYYAPSLPSWMALNSTNGVLSGTATGNAGSGSASVYVIKGSYKSPTKLLSYRTIAVIPLWSYSRINIDITTLLRSRAAIKTSYTIDITDCLAAIPQDISFSLSSDKAMPNGTYSFATVSVSQSYANNTLKLSLNVEKQQSKTIKDAADNTVTLTASGVAGSSNISLRFYCASKDAYNSSYSTSDSTPIVTYS